MTKASQQDVKVVKETSEIEIEFELSIFDGPLVEKTEPGEVFRFQIGDGQFLPNLEGLLVGLEVDTQAKFTLVPEQAFGRSDPNNFQRMPRTDFAKDMPLEVGHVIGFHTPTGEEIPGTILEVCEDSVMMDFNHPLADKILVFQAKIISILS